MKSFSELSEFFPPAAADYDYNNSPYLNMESRGDLLETQFANYSDLSVDSSSESSEYAKWKIQGNQNCYSPPSLVESSYIYGSSGREDPGTCSPFELPEPCRSQYSDDEMNELFSLDPTVLQRTLRMDDQEELRYLREVVHQAEYYRECHPGTAHDDPYWNMELPHEAGGDLFPADTLSWKALYAEERLAREQLFAEGEILKANAYEMFQQSATPSVYEMLQQPTPKLRRSRAFFTADTNLPETHPHGKRDNHPKEAPSLALHCSKPLPKPASDGDQRVFLGGLPAGMTERSLRQQLAAQGYKVLKRPKILRGFAPEVLMRSVQEAKELVERGKIMLNGLQVEVRPFNSFMKQSESKKIPNIEKRSVFLGGLPTGTTVNDIQNVFMKMDIRIMNYPVVKFGFARQVILENVLQAKTLIQKKKILIRGTFVDVRPFANQPRRRKSH